MNGAGENAGIAWNVVHPMSSPKEREWRVLVVDRTLLRLRLLLADGDPSAETTTSSTRRRPFSS